MHAELLEPTIFVCSACGHKEPLTEFAACSKCACAQIPLLEDKLAQQSSVSFDTDLSALLETPSCLPVHRILARYTQSCGITFSVGDNKIEAINVFQPEAFLPVIALEAMRIWQSIERPAGQVGEQVDSLQANLTPSSSGLFPMSAFPPAIGSDISSTLRLLVFTLAARRTLGLREGFHIDLLPHLMSWEQIDWSSDTLPQLPIPGGFDLDFQRTEFSQSYNKPQADRTLSSAQDGADRLANQST